MAGAHGGRRAATLVLSTVAAGLAAGVAVSIFAFLLARYGPAGGNWSFRGNGALVAYTAVPGLLAGGWTALLLRARRHPAWLPLGAAAALVGLALAAADAVLLPLFGESGDRIAGTPLLLALAGWSLAAPALASRIPGPAFVFDRHAAAAVAWLVAILVGLILGGLAAPAGS